MYVRMRARSYVSTRVYVSVCVCLTVCLTQTHMYHMHIVQTHVHIHVTHRTDIDPDPAAVNIPGGTPAPGGQWILGSETLAARSRSFEAVEIGREHGTQVLQRFRVSRLSASALLTSE